MNLTNVKSLTIDDKVVKKLELNGTVIWQTVDEDDTGILPIGYTELTYIESSGTQYLDTGIVPVIGYTAEIGFQYTGGSASGEKWAIAVYMNGSWRAGANGSNFWTAQGFTYDQTDYTAYVNATGTSTVTLASNVTMYMFGQRQHSGVAHVANSIFKIYYCRIYDTDGNLIFNFIPCINADGVVGAYDTVSQTFLTNLGTGEFIAGEVV